MDTMFVLPKAVVANFSSRTLNSFLYKNRMYAEYLRSGKTYLEYVQENINNGRLSSYELGTLLYDDLCYGNQRLIHMYKICSCSAAIRTKNDLLEMIQKKYPYVDSLNYNQILYQPYNEGIKELVGVSVSLGVDGCSIKKINLIFSEKCFYSDTDGTHSEYSYITVDIDLVKKFLYVKVSPKSKPSSEEMKTVNLADRYFSIVSKQFEMIFHDFSSDHKTVLCRMNIELYEQIYQKMVQAQPKDLNEFIKNVSDEIIQKLEIEDYREKVADNNVFNIQDTLKKMLEHILISDILYENGKDDSLEGVDGYVSYVKFSDGTQINARLRSENYTEPIFSSEAYMALRSSINNAKAIAILKVVWIDKFWGARVSYDATNSQYLSILLYKNYTREQFEYAVEKYCQCESRKNKSEHSFFAMEA